MLSHATVEVWEAVARIADPGTMDGKQDVQPDGETGRMSFDIDGVRFWVAVYKSLGGLVRDKP